jgi:hypothetical protein
VELRQFRLHSMLVISRRNHPKRILHRAEYTKW